MKKTSLTLIIALTLTSSVWAQATIEEPADDYKKVECSSDKLFEDNICDACYTDSLEMNATNEITDAVIPWEYKSEGDLSEIIYDNEQVYPEIKSTLAVVTKPEKAEELWENDETLKWEPFDQYKESVITKDQKVGIYRLKSGSKMTVAQSQVGDKILFVTPLTYHEFNAEISEESKAKKRTICVLGTMTANNSTATPVIDEPKNNDPVVIPETTPETVTPDLNVTSDTNPTLTTETNIAVDIPALNAAGPESEIESTPTVEEQTSVKTGPGLWIILLLAFVFGGAWNAYKKSKITQ